MSEYAKFNALQTVSSDWIMSGKGNVSLSTSGIYIAYAGEYAAGNKGLYEYGKSIKVSNSQIISFYATIGGKLPQNTMLYIYYKLKTSSTWSQLKLFDGSVDGYNIAYTARVPISGEINIRLEYGVSGYNCPININITKFTIE